MSRAYKRPSVWLFAALLASAGLLYAYFITPRVATGWHYQVFAQDLPEVSAIAFDGSGGLYATLEHRHGQGRLLHIRQGHVRELLGGLDKPDGILVRGASLYITNEAGARGLAVYAAGTLHYLEGVTGAEGIGDASDGGILVIEDRKKGGRLLRIDPVTSRIEVLLEGLSEAEGVCQTPGGEIFYVEKSSDRLVRVSGGRSSTVATGLVKPAFLNCLADGSILITEDRTNLGRLLRYHQGTVEVLASHLHSPQSVIVGDDGACYLAEQRRNRILRIARS